MIYMIYMSSLQLSYAQGVIQYTLKSEHAALNLWYLISERTNTLSAAIYEDMTTETIMHMQVLRGWLYWLKLTPKQML